MVPCQRLNIRTKDASNALIMGNYKGLRRFVPGTRARNHYVLSIISEFLLGLYKIY